MFRVSNNLILLINFSTLILSIPIILEAKSLGKDSDCEKWLQKAILIFGICIMVLSTIGMIGVCCSSTACLCIYLFLMNLIIIALFAFNIFLYVITNKGVGEAVSGLGFEEYRLGDYSHWLQRRVENVDNWNNIKSCLQRVQLCAKFYSDHQNDTVQPFYQSHLSSVQSGCCKPSRVCGFEYESAIVWKKPENGTTSSSDPDCNAWDNNPSILCFNCDACKAGVLDNIRNSWLNVCVVNFTVILLLWISIPLDAVLTETTEGMNSTVVIF
ncbi:tetraspanin-8-like [Prosopis cineraria]|uniref:tetraspanin-8-like n=1 Tax=Prosopis cineraria TaxID=364024 RepID=UPI0024106321|nr:tetraspanin-8-like [Prosopis cineraria]